MLKPTFNIHTDNELSDIPRQYRLLMEVGKQGCNCLLLDLRKMSPEIIRSYQFSHVKDKQPEELLKEIIDEDDLFRREISDFIMIYNFEESSLIPDIYFGAEMNKELIELFHGNLEKGFLFSEKIPWWDIHNVYRVPAGIHNLLREEFANARHWHVYSLLLKSYRMFQSDERQDLLKVIFSEDNIIALVFKKGQLQLIQSFIYREANDVIYYLLNCCKQYALNTGDLHLEVSGLIERHSLLFREASKYFVNISFEAIGDNVKVTEELSEYPIHYFSSLLKMSICV
jgi:hypothetical protein